MTTGPNVNQALTVLRLLLAAVFPSRDRLNRFVTAVTGQYR